MSLFRAKHCVAISRETLCRVTGSRRAALALASPRNAVSQNHESPSRCMARSATYVMATANGSAPTSDHSQAVWAVARVPFGVSSVPSAVATVSKHVLTLIYCKFTVDVPGPDDLEATGSFFDYEYAFTRHGREVATVSKRYFSWTDSYGVDIADGEDHVLILASTAVIDLCCHADAQA